MNWNSLNFIFYEIVIRTSCTRCNAWMHVCHAWHPRTPKNCNNTHTKVSNPILREWKKIGGSEIIESVALESFSIDFVLSLSGERSCNFLSFSIMWSYCQSNMLRACDICDNNITINRLTQIERERESIIQWKKLILHNV